MGEDDEGVPEDIFCELYRALAPALTARPSVEDLADIIDNPAQSRDAFEKTTAEDSPESERSSGSSRRLITRWKSSAATS